MSLTDPVHLHLMLNHVPVLGTMFALILMGIGLLARRQHLQKLGLVVIMMSALVALPVFLTGEPAEEVVEHLPGVIESAIDTHEDAAKLAFASVLTAGVIGIVGLYLSRGARSLPLPAAIVALAACLVTTALMARTANLGGKIRHSELNSGTATNMQREEHRHDDND